MISPNPQKIFIMQNTIHDDYAQILFYTSLTLLLNYQQQYIVNIAEGGLTDIYAWHLRACSAWGRVQIY